MWVSVTVLHSRDIRSQRDSVLPRLRYSIASKLNPSGSIKMSEFGSTRKKRAYESSMLAASPASSIKSLRSTAELDELKLQNEQLQDEVREARGELDRAKERHARQITFLEEENDKMKKSVTDAKERYYEEKKKWQAKYREASKTANNLSVSFSSPPPTATTKKSDNLISLDDNTERDKWTVRLETLEKDMKRRAEEAGDLAAENADLKKKLAELEGVSALQAVAAGGSPKTSTGGEEYRAEARELRKKCGDLEISLRRKTRELERLEAKVQNQSILEEELNSATSKNKTMVSAVEGAKSIEAQYHSMLEERKTWSALFKDIVNANKDTAGDDFESFLMSYGNGSGEISPMALLKAFSATQQKASLLLKDRGDLQSQVKNLKHTVAQGQKDLKDAQAAKKGESKDKNSLENKLQVAARQVRLYETEITSLRSLLKSYDNEFSMGKRPTKEDFLKAKNDLIDRLRVDLDKVRQEAALLLKEKQEGTLLVGEGEAAGIVGKEKEDSAEMVSKLTAQVTSLKEELYQLKAAAGLDYVPGKLRVLHFKENPAMVAARTRGGEEWEKYQAAQKESTVPLVALKAAKEEIKRLHEGGAVEKKEGEGAEKVAKSVEPAPLPSAIDSSKLNLRLKEMFKERITTFRECVYLLTGWKIDLIFDGCKEQGTSKPQLRLRNMYAEQPEDSLLFFWTEDNKLNLMETPFAQRMNPKLLEVLQTLNSVPIFLGAIESDLFDNQTVM